MKVNEILCKDDAVFRVLAIESDRCLCIDCSGTKMPSWMPLEALEGCQEAPEPEKTENLTPRQKQAAHERFTLIAPALAFLKDDAERKRIMSVTAESHDISLQTLRRYFCTYLVYQDISALAPAERKQTHVLTQDQKNMRWALNKYFYTTKKSKLTDAYIHLLKERYCDPEGKLLPKYPSLRQFRYFETRHRKQENYLISRNGLKNYQRNDRPLLGDGIQEFAPNVGLAMLDATVCDIYLVNDAGQVVGRPILVAGVDANTSLCLGYALLWEGGVYSLQQLMLNIITDKTELCHKMGIAIEERQWPASGCLPCVMVTDMGSEYIGETFEQIAELGVTLINLPAFRPDLKGAVEKLFDLVQEKYKDVLKGKGVIMPDFQERGAHDYRKDACLTLDEFERIVVRCIIYYNSERVLNDYPYSEDMLENQVKPYACDVWNHKVEEPETNLVPVTAQEVVLTLLPRTEGKFTRYGLIVNKLRYHRDGYKEVYLNGGKYTVSYNPDDAGTVWLKAEDGSYEEFQLIEAKYSGMTFSQVSEKKQVAKALVRKEQTASLQAKINLLDFIETASERKEKPTNANIKGIRENRKSEKHKSHEDIGRVLKDG